MVLNEHLQNFDELPCSHKFPDFVKVFSRMKTKQKKIPMHQGDRKVQKCVVKNGGQNIKYAYQLKVIMYKPMLERKRKKE